MNEQERLAKVDELVGLISPINYNRILLETKLYVIERQSNKDSQEIQNLTVELQGLYDQLSPLFQQLRSIQCHYEVEFQGELTNPNDKTYWNNPERQIFHLQNCCNVDTFADSWQPFINDPCVNKLLLEVYQVIFQRIYSNFKILNIKRIV